MYLAAMVVEIRQGSLKNANGEGTPQKMQMEGFNMKIDTSKIEGYQEMTAEDKIVALEGYEMEAPEPEAKEVQRLREALSKSNREAA